MGTSHHNIPTIVIIVDDNRHQHHYRHPRHCHHCYFKSKIFVLLLDLELQVQPCCLTTGLTRGPEKATEKPLLLEGKYAYLRTAERL